MDPSFPGYLIFLFQVALNVALYSCPLGWDNFNGHCYKFDFGKALTYEDANSACWIQGGSLVSVNTRGEYDFIANWLLRHDQWNANTWYTSGEYSMGQIRWYGDGSYLNDTSAYYHGSFPDEQNQQSYITYVFTETTKKYEWSMVPGDDKRQFICEIPLRDINRIVQMNRKFDYGIPATTFDKLQMGPKVDIFPNNEVVIGDSPMVYLECLAQGNPQPRHIWYEQTDSGWEELDIASDNRYTFSGGRFSIENPVEVKDAGIYRCKMENSFGSVTSVPISLSFGQLGQFSPNTPGPVEAALYQGTFIQCNPPSAKPALTYQWYKDTIFNFIRPELQNYQFISSNGNLYFSEVQEHDSGFYHCVVTLTVGPGYRISTIQPPSRTSKGIELKIKGNPSSEYGPIIHNDFIAVFPKPALVGQDIRLECFAYGRMPLIYAWTRGDGSLPERYKLLDSNRILVIPDAKMQDEGNYTCHVQSRIGSGTTAKDIYLVIQAIPVFILPLHDMHADEGSELIWRCEVRAKPWATYTWYKNSVHVTNIPHEIEIRENVLWIRRLNKSRDSGMYQCIATNALGSATSGAQLRVLSFKPSFDKNPPPPEVLAGNGGNVTIDCAPEAAPVPDISWYKNGGDLGLVPSQDGRVRMNIEGSLVITKVSPADEGFYKCVAKNVNGESEITLKLTVVSDLTFFRSPIDAVVDVNQTHFFYCEASYNYEVFDLVYVWKFNGRIINTDRDPFYKRNVDTPGSRGLYIINAQFKHAGVYECIAQTRLAEITASAQLSVRGPPGEPAGVYAEKGQRNATAIRLYWSWSPAADNGAPIAYYIVEARTNYDPKWKVLKAGIPSEMTKLQNPEHPNRRSYVVNNLSPHTSYSFRIRAVNVPHGAGDPSIPTGFYLMPSDKPTVAPTNVGGGGGSEGTLTITWDPLSRADEAGHGFGYEAFWKLTNDTTWSNSKVGNITKYTVTLTRDLYFLLYDVKVRAYNDIGYGPESSVNQIYSAEGVPLIQVQNLRGYPINGTAVMVTWDPLPDSRDVVKGKVAGYEIDYYDMNNPRGVADSLYLFEPNDHAIVIGLQPYQDYWFNIEVFNSAATGTPSEKYKISTNENPPSKYPEFVYVYSHGHGSVKVQWRGVSTGFREASLEGYKLKWWKAGDEIQTAMERSVGIVDEAVIDGIEKDNVYKLRVMAYNRGGDGKNSPTVFFTLGGQVAFDAETAQILTAESGSENMQTTKKYLTTAFVILHGLVAIL
ncbi:hypothetical protein ACJMK2_010736 [Sinanodonta woodiana]|uniref:Contactin n=1 Tax=Sinanodonta woodiana TaxID=1069815 RepID=A0ABD3VGN8_SINWO